MSLRSERDKAVLETEFARDRLNRFTAELEHQVLSFCSRCSVNISVFHTDMMSRALSLLLHVSS